MIESVRPGASAKRARVVLFDFDGTLSLIRSGWVEVMVPMMVEVLAELKSGESEAELKQVVDEFVARLTGKQTIYQMIELANQVRARGGEPEDPLVYKRWYLDRLWNRIRGRVDELEKDIARRRSTWFPALSNCWKPCAQEGSSYISPAAPTRAT